MEQKNIITLADFVDGVRNNGFKHIMEYSKKHHLRIIDEKNGERMLITSPKKNIISNNPITWQCNSLIFEKSTWKTLSIGPPHMKRSISPDDCTDFKNGCFDIIPASDGSIVTMYFYGKKWCYSTTNSYEVEDTVWNNITFSNAFLTIALKDKYFTSLAGADLNKLDKDYCYTFGFTNRDIHYYEGSEEKIWFIQKVNLKTMNFEKSTTMLNLQLDNISSLYKAVKHISYEQIAQIMSNKKPTLFTGLILRHNKDKCNIFLPSGLYLFIQSIVYRRIPKRVYATFVSEKKITIDYSTFDRQFRKTYNEIRACGERACGKKALYEHMFKCKLDYPSNIEPYQILLNIYDKLKKTK